jgi:hypothetical protein
MFCWRHWDQPGAGPDEGAELFLWLEPEAAAALQILLWLLVLSR